MVFIIQDVLSELINTTFTFISSKENEKSFNSQKKLRITVKIVL